MVNVKPTLDSSDGTGGSSAATIRDRIAEQLRFDIVTGALAPDSKLKLDRLKARYGVGGSPLREALARLVGTGLVRAEPQRGFCVAGSSHEDLEDVTRLRLLIEPEALRQSMARGDENWEAMVVAAFHRLERRTLRGDHQTRDSFPKWEEAHRAFHVALVAQCGSARLIKLQSELYDQVLRYRANLIEFGLDPEALSAEHRTLKDAVLSGDKNAAVKNLKQHLSLTRDIMRLKETET